MGMAIVGKLFDVKAENRKEKMAKEENLTNAKVNHSYEIKGINTEENGIKDFLFTLGCFEGEIATVISVLADNYIINIKDARYSIDADLAKAILI